MIETGEDLRFPLKPSNVRQLVSVATAEQGLHATTPSDAAAHRTVMPSVPHITRQYENNRAEVSHQPTRQRERQMRRFTSIGHAQHFLSLHGCVQNLFRTGRHLLRAVHHRLLRARAFGLWHEVTCA